MIVRLWRGWTAPENADRYETLLRSQIFPAGILGRRHCRLRRDRAAAPGCRRGGGVRHADAAHLARGNQSLAGEDDETAVVPPAARAVLSRFDAKSLHYEMREDRTPD